jgi:hypothetical protein
MKPGKLRIAVPLLTLSLLATLFVESMLRTSPASAEPYHQHIAEVAATLPYQAGSWVGEDTEVPSAATALLRPNVIISRRYQNVRTGHNANLLLVQCRDSRDMLGHYPPVCYPGTGWTLASQIERQAVATNASYPAMEYDFTRTTGGQLSRVTVIDFMVLPDGRVVRTMEELRFAARKRAARFYGAAQIQLLFDPNVPDPERDQAVKTILDAAGPILQGIQSGERQ